MGDSEPGPVGRVSRRGVVGGAGGLIGTAIGLALGVRDRQTRAMEVAAGTKEGLKTLEELGYGEWADHFSVSNRGPWRRL